MKDQLNQLKEFRIEYNRLWHRIENVRTVIIDEYFDNADIRVAEITEDSTELCIAYLASEFGEFADKQPVKIINEHYLVFLDGSGLVIDNFQIGYGDDPEEAIECLQTNWIHRLENINGNFQ